MKLWFIRHGETEANLAGVYSGASETPLTAKGQQQARMLRELLASVAFDRVITSELGRAQETARLALAGRHFTMETDSRLNEMNFGRWELRHHQDIAREDSEHYAAWCADWQQVVPPEGEGFQAFSLRVKDLASALLLAPESQQNVLLVSHKGVLGLLLAHLLEMPAASLWHFAIEQGCWSEVEINGGYGVLRTLNNHGPCCHNGK